MTPSKEKDEISLDNGALLKAALKLKEALEHSELNETALAALAKVLPQREQNSDWVKLRNAVNRFDFDDALVLLEQLCQPYRNGGDSR